ncbi:MFS transporter [Streptomyces swartbergensis]|uniref:hypothetical protein n=1 Tax=Streptomyces swartbergensis TaxID=487165 RepID=UPI00381FEAC1
MTPLLLALAPYTWVLVVANFVAGVGVEKAGVAWYSTVNEQIPEGRLARVYAYDDLGSCLALPLAQFTAGPAVLLLGLHATLTRPPRSSSSPPSPWSPPPPSARWSRRPQNRCPPPKTRCLAELDSDA